MVFKIYYDNMYWWIHRSATHQSILSLECPLKPCFSAYNFFQILWIKIAYKVLTFVNVCILYAHIHKS